MKELVLMFSPSLPASKKLISNSKFIELMKYVSQHVPVKNVVVGDEKTRSLLLKAKRTQIPLLLIDTGEDIIEINRVNYIMKFLIDLETNIKAHTNTRRDNTSTERDFNDDDEELTTPVYKNVFFVDCDKSNNVRLNKFDSVIISETCKKVHFEDDNITYVNTTNLASMKKIIGLLDENKKVLIISKDKRLADIVVAMLMFHVEKKTLAETEKTAGIVLKRPLRDLFKRIEDTIPGWESE